MSWFSGNSVSTVELDNKITEATSESIPNGEIELSVALEITDLIRSKKIPAKACMRALKKRLTLVQGNPNIVSSTLKLVDLCVKNSGYHFLVEISSKEFIDYLVDVLLKIHYNTSDSSVRNIESKLNVGNMILELIQDWSVVFAGQLQLNYVEKTYKQLVSEGFKFPAKKDGNSYQLNSTFVDSEVPPDWVDNDSCMICYNAFSMLSRKHHCRACGGVFCQTHSNNFIPLVSLGIREPVRVCDNCFTKHRGKHRSSPSRGSKSTGSAVEEEDDELKRAIELSLQESGPSYQRPASPPPPEVAPAPAPAEEEEDDEMKAAIAASLKEFENQERLYKSQQQEYERPAQAPPTSDFYNNILPFDAEEHSSPSFQPSFQPTPPVASPPAQRPTQTKVEDLTQQEESQINLFITLMNTVKNDPKKRANVMYDSNLSELHSQVIRLKPKVNKSLRASIEKYETFLELNNKIATIIKLYDQFLEDKLNSAYGNHKIQPANNYYDFSGAQQQQLEHVPRQNTGYPYQPNGPAHSNSYVSQQHTGYVSQQNTAFVAPQTSGYGYNSAPTPAPAPASIVSRQPTGYPSNFQQPSEPTFGSDDEDEEKEPDSKYSYPSTIDNKQYPNLAYPVSYSGLPGNRENGGHGGTEGGPSYPPVNYSPEMTDTETDNERNERPQGVRRKSSSLAPFAVEEATAKFPTIENVESNYQANSTPYPVASDVKHEDHRPKSEEYKPKIEYKAEPEPLIEL